MVLEAIVSEPALGHRVRIFAGRGILGRPEIVALVLDGLEAGDHLAAGGIRVEFIAVQGDEPGSHGRGIVTVFILRPEVVSAAGNGGVAGTQDTCVGIRVVLEAVQREPALGPCVDIVAVFGLRPEIIAPAVDPGESGGQLAHGT